MDESRVEKGPITYWKIRTMWSAVLRHLMLRSPMFDVESVLSLKMIHTGWDELGVISHPEAMVKLRDYVECATESANRYVRAKAYALLGLADETDDDWRSEVCALLNEHVPEGGVDALIAYRLLHDGTAPGWLIAGLVVAEPRAADYPLEWQGQDVAEWKALDAEGLIAIVFGLYHDDRPGRLSRFLALRNPSADERLLCAYTRSPSWVDRLGVALHPDLAGAHFSLHATLVNDGNRYVRAAARAHLRDNEITQ